MPSIRRGRGTPKRASLPSAEEVLYQMRGDLGNAGFESAPLASSKAEFKAIRKLMQDDTNEIYSSYRYGDEYNQPSPYENLAGLPASMDTAYGRQFYEAIGLTGDLRVPGMEGPQYEEDTSPADLTVIPTSTTNPQRPRTVAAGYDEDEEKLTVMFRDGTLYNYYEVDKSEWQAFKANRSKGAVIYRMLDFKPRGQADDSSISAEARAALYRLGRGVQSYRGGKIASQDKAVYKTVAQSKRGKKGR